MHKPELIDLSRYRLEKAHDMLKAALRDMDNGDYSLNYDFQVFLI